MSARFREARLDRRRAEGSQRRAEWRTDVVSTVTTERSSVSGNFQPLLAFPEAETERFDRTACIYGLHLNEEADIYFEK